MNPVRNFVDQRDNVAVEKVLLEKGISNGVNIVFFGTPEFGATILEKLIRAQQKPVLVVTVPDKKAGRKQLLTPPPVKILAEKYGIPVIQPEKLNLIKFRANLMRLSLQPDLIVLASYGVILPKEVLAIPKKGALNVHPSLLPKYRGPSPVQSAILEGEKTTGVTIMQMDEELDHGPIVAHQEVAVENLNAAELRQRLAEAGGELLVQTIPQWVEGHITPKEQDHSKATFTKRFGKKDGRIDWKQKAEYIARQIRAFTPWPGTFCTWQGKTLKIHQGKAQEISQNHASLPPGTAIPFNDGFAVITGNGMLAIEKLQMEGRNPVSAKDFLLGHKDFLGTTLN